jgi:hypothetical protein
LRGGALHMSGTSSMIAPAGSDTDKICSSLKRYRIGISDVGFSLKSEVELP